MGLASIGLAFVRLVLSLSFAIIGLYIASWVLGRLTKKINEWEEIREGNYAVAIYMASIFVSVSIIIGPGILGLFRTLELIGIMLGFVQLIIALILAIVVQYVGLSIFNKLIKIDIWIELKNRNIAISIVIAGIVIAISSIVAKGIQSIIEAILV